MPRRSSETIVDTTGPVLTPLDAIPNDVKKYVEDTLKKQERTPSRERAIYDSQEERDAEFKLMVDYGKQRPQGLLKIRMSPTRKANFPKGVNPDTVMDWRVSKDIEANGARNAGNDRRQATS